jgi:predicted metal-dependent hydrolase
MTIRRLRGEPPVEITLRRSARARRFSLRVSRIDGRVTLSLPAQSREADALAFAEGHGDWIRRTLARNGPRIVVAAGADLPFQGRTLVVTPASLRAPLIEGDRLLVPPDPARIGLRTAAFLRLAARHRLQAASEHYAGIIGRPFRRITLRDTRSRWGSCTTDGSLMYSWRLIMAPPAVLDYVAAHEVAHLSEMNHAPAFWRAVERLMPGYEAHRRWLKRQGGHLHRYDFGATPEDEPD